MDIFDIRQANLITVESKFGMKKEFAAAVDVTPAYIRQLKKGDREINEKTARKIERRLNLPPSFLDRVHVELSSVNVVNEDLDVLIGNIEQEGMDHLEGEGEFVKQSWLDKHGYSVSELQTIVNTHSNMSPEYMLGDRLIVNKAIDSGDRNYLNNTNYVFNDGIGSYIVHKVHTRMNGDLLLTSLNKQEMPDDLIASSDVIDLKCLGVIVKMVRYN